MKRKMVLLLGIMVLALGLVGTPASWANSLEFQGITFGLNLDVSGNLNLTMSGEGTGNWSGVTSLDAFAINDFGSATGLAVSGWTTVPGGLSASGPGCNSTGASFTCFNGNTVTFPANNVAVDLTITHSGGSFNLSTPPTLKVLFDINGEPCAPGCDLLSKAIPVTSVPEPASLLLLGAGLAGLGIWRRKINKV